MAYQINFLLVAVHYEAQTVTQTHKSCTIAASHHPWTDSPTKEEHESAPQSFRVEWQPAVPNHEQFSPHSSITVTGQHAPPVPVNQFPFCGIPFALPDTLEASREFGSDGALAIRPITETPVPRPPNSGLEPLHQYAHCRLLIAEDNAVNQRLISKIFQKLGLPNSTLVINGLLAVEKVQESMEIMLPFDLIFMDESMPVMSGREATRQIRAIGYRGIVCGMTASAFTSDVQGALDAGMDTVLKKPIRTHDIRNVLVQSLPHLPQEPESVSPSPLPRQKPVVKSRL